MNNSCLGPWTYIGIGCTRTPKSSIPW